MIREIPEVEIKPRSFADHNPMIIKMSKKQKISNWRINPLDLEQEEFIEKLSKEMGEFYIRNNTEGMEKRTIWDVSKAYLRGLAIQNRIRRQKEKNKKYKELILSLKKEEEEHVQNNMNINESKKIMEKIKKIQHQINLLLTEEMAGKLRYAKQFFF